MTYLESLSSFKLKIFVLAFLLIISCSYAYIYETPEITPWQLLCFIALMIGVILISLFYVFAFVTSVEILKLSAKEELKQIVITGVAIALFIIILHSLETATLGGGRTIYQEAIEINYNDTQNVLKLENELSSIKNINVQKMIFKD